MGDTDNGPILQVAVVLCGCGRADGSEIHESVSVLVHLARLGVRYRCFAPDRALADVVDHRTGCATGETRNALAEAARIARGEIQDLAELKPAEFAALFIPGGFGVAKNLCDFAETGVGMKVLPGVERVIREFHGLGRPMGLCCIAPVLAAKVLGAEPGGVRVTLGDDDSPAARAVSAWGGTHVPARVDEVVTDAERRVVTTPAYMHGRANPHEVFAGIGGMVEGTLGLIAGGGTRVLGSRAGAAR
jgi:enhancing lycopene biosynthesis protein 2